jgi:hypothetical protein
LLRKFDRIKTIVDKPLFGRFDRLRRLKARREEYRTTVSENVVIALEFGDRMLPYEARSKRLQKARCMAPDAFYRFRLSP